MLKKRLTALLTICALASALLSACIAVYKIDIQQGNVITPEMVEKLKLGMNRSQVRFVLGTPLLTDPFHNDRWDYFYSFKKGGAKTVETRRVTVFFEQDKLIHVEGDIPAHHLKETTKPQSQKDEPPSGGIQLDQARPAS